MGNLSTQRILQEGFSEYEKKHGVPLYKQKAVNALMKCRSAALGGHVQECPEGHFKRIWYNSCRHRFCPLCAFIRIARWLAKQKARLLACDHYHVIFTIPEELNIIWLYNELLMISLLFQAVRETLFELMGDVKYLGAKPGIIAALHTWGQTLVFHPHIHCLVTGGGLTALGKWIGVNNGFLLPARVVMALFRNKLIQALRQAFEKGEIVLPPNGMRPQQFINLLNKLRYKKKKWNVRIMERYSHGEGVATYLARYLRGGAIGNSRILAFDGNKVTFSYYDNHDPGENGKGKKKTMTLSTEEFIGRLLLHVAIPGVRQVRSWGLYANGKKEELAQCREQLGQPPVEEEKKIDWQSLCERWGDEHPERCPICGRKLISTRVFHRGDLPPPDLLMEKAA